ncbi:MAG TPA: hypothetical protein VKY74_11280 [Chloroflexia bacterium]|nr:hypothetical protein [Chloroflexia bacterium]
MTTTQAKAGGLGMARIWFMRLGLVAAVLGFTINLGIHLLTLWRVDPLGNGWAFEWIALLNGFLLLVSICSNLILVLGIEQAKIKGSLWMRITQNIRTAPWTVKILYLILLILTVNLFVLVLTPRSFDVAEVKGRIDSLKLLSASFMPMFLIRVISILQGYTTYLGQRKRDHVTATLVDDGGKIHLQW